MREEAPWREALEAYSDKLEALASQSAVSEAVFDSSRQ